nr:MAG TPA: hypothetical protein [Caudoviricetes sp.]
MSGHKARLYELVWSGYNSSTRRVRQMRKGIDSADERAQSPFIRACMEWL